MIKDCHPNKAKNKFSNRISKNLAIFQIEIFLKHKVDVLKFKTIVTNER